jgi:hypothetical protein
MSTCCYSQIQLYVNNSDLGSFVNPTSDQDTTIILDDINIPTSLLLDNDSISITRITFGLGRTQNSEAAKLKFYYSPFNQSFTTLSDVCTQPPVYFAELDIPQNPDPGAAFYYTVGDGITPLFKLKIEPTVLVEDAFTFFLGVSIDKKIKSSFGGLIRRGSGWGLTNAGQSPWLDSAWAYSPRAGQGGLFTVVDQNNNPFPQTYNVNVEGIPFKVLPVTLANFSGQIKGGNAYLEWQTVSESNNLGFDIERSFDGVSFKKIGFVSGQGTTTQKTDYNYSDVNIPASVNNNVHYRLRQVDADGKFEYSKVISLQISRIAKWFVYPNPVTDQSAIQLSLEKTARVQVQIVNSQGAIISTINKGLLDAGTYAIPLSLGAKTPGVYLVRILVDDEVYTQKIVR